MPFEPGQSGNPSGVVWNRPFWDALRRASAQEDGKRIRAAAEKLLDAAANGEAWAITALADRTDGRPKQAVEHTGEEGGPIKHSLTVGFRDRVPDEASEPVPPT